MTLETKLTMALAGCSGSCSANSEVLEAPGPTRGLTWGPPGDSPAALRVQGAEDDRVDGVVSPEEQPVETQGEPFSGHSGATQGPFRGNSGAVQGPLRGRSGATQGPLRVSVMPWAETLKWTRVEVGGGSAARVWLAAFCTACCPVRDSSSTEPRYHTAEGGGVDTFRANPGSRLKPRLSRPPHGFQQALLQQGSVPPGWSPPPPREISPAGPSGGAVGPGLKGDLKEVGGVRSVHAGGGVELRTTEVKAADPLVLEHNIPWQGSGVIHMSALNTSASVEPVRFMLSKKFKESAQKKAKIQSNIPEEHPEHVTLQHDEDQTEDSASWCGDGGEVEEEEEEEERRRRSCEAG
ncbi:hypothetical protein CRUP_033476 [Coryphaenoides rupestris]|nr:hypothetical protein CRUP_033476 [Coryphaenoides rupestris]